MTTARTRIGTARSAPRLAGLCALVMAIALSAAATATATAPAERARTVSADGATDGQPRFEWPIRPPPDVVRGFDPTHRRYGPGHRGIDLGARVGQPVLAAGGGTVVFAGQLAGRGVISIAHDHLRTTYEPVDAAVTEGEQVYAGQRIGRVAAGHRGCKSACLHWGVRRGDPPEYLDPLELVVPVSRIRLKPWAGPP